MLFLRNIFLLICILSSTQAAFSFPMNAESSSSSSSAAYHSPPSTPPATTVATAPATDIRETPAQLLSRKQARVLQRQAFNDIIGIEEVDSWEIKWEVFQDLSSPSTSDKLLNLRKLTSAMKLLLNQFLDNEQFDRLYGAVVNIRDRLEAVHLERLQSVIKNYFQRCFPDSTITFGIKSSGVQLGTIATIQEPNEKTHQFFVKTHSAGKLSERSLPATTVAPKELLVYKILQTLGFGLQVHFCARSPEDVYIATRDAGEGGEFFTFARFTENENTLGPSLWGNLGKSIMVDPWKSDRQHVESGLNQDPGAQHFASQVAALDILTRLLRLHDLLNNKSNFGFFKPSHSASFDLRVLDFRVLEDQDLKFTDSHFSGFLEGNGLFRYDTAHRTISYLLHHREEKERVRNAVGVMGHILQNLGRAIEEAYAFVETYLSRDPAFEAQREPLLEGLRVYHDIVKQNVALFIGHLERYKRATLGMQDTGEGAASYE